jgi:hypothetical protein
MLTGIDELYVLPKKEKILLEAYLFIHLHHELRTIFSKRYRKYLQIIKFDTEKEDAMLDANFLLYLINDILSTEEYSLTGIAHYTRIPEEIIFDVISGLNKNPSSTLWRKVIELHSTVRRDLYQELIKKILANQNISKQEDSTK